MSEHSEPRAAIVGAGLMGRWHADAVRRIGGRVSVIVDPDDAARSALARRHPEARLVAELDAIDIAREATAAHVCTPVSTHVSIVSRLIAAGVPALVEKPFADNAPDTASLLSSASERRVIVCPVHQFVFQDGVRRIIDWLPKLGRARRLEFSTCSAGAALEDRGALDALVAEILPHPLSLIAAVLGARLAGVNWQVAYPTAGELRAMTTINDTIIDIAISSHGRPTENVFRLVGDAGSATADLFHGFAVRHDGAVSRNAKIAHPFVAAGAVLGGATANLARRIAAREPAYPGLRELVRQFYSATRGERATPIPPYAVADVAASRDELLARIRATAPTG